MWRGRGAPPSSAVALGQPAGPVDRKRAAAKITGLSSAKPGVAWGPDGSRRHLDPQDLGALASKEQPTVQHKGPGSSCVAISATPKKFCALDPPLSLDDAAPDATKATLQRRRAGDTRFLSCRATGGRGCWSSNHQLEAPDPLPDRKASAPAAPVQAAGWAGWPSCTRFDHGAAGDDMGPGQDDPAPGPLLQHLKSERKLKRPVLLGGPTSVLTHWKPCGAEPALTPEPDRCWMRTYGPRRPATPAALAKALRASIWCFTRLPGLLHTRQRAAGLDWTGRER